jgi:hypothetical protein
MKKEIANSKPDIVIHVFSFLKKTGGHGFTADDTYRFFVPNATGGSYARRPITPPPACYSLIKKPGLLRANPFAPTFGGG